MHATASFRVKPTTCSGITYRTSLSLPSFQAYKPAPRYFSNQVQWQRRADLPRNTTQFFMLPQFRQSQRLTFHTSTTSLISAKVFGDDLETDAFLKEVMEDSTFSDQLASTKTKLLAAGLQSVGKMRSAEEGVWDKMGLSVDVRQMLKEALDSKHDEDDDDPKMLRNLLLGRWPDGTPVAQFVDDVVTDPPFSKDLLQETKDKMAQHNMRTVGMLRRATINQWKKLDLHKWVEGALKDSLGIPFVQDPSKVKYFRRGTLPRTNQMGMFDVHPNYNKSLTDILEELAKIEKNKGDSYKHKAYQRAIFNLKSLPYAITTPEQVNTLEGIGKKLAAKIVEILQTGQLRQLEEEKVKEDVKAINLLCKIIGFGPKQVNQLVAQGIRTIEDLKKLKLTGPQQLGVKYFEELEKRIPRTECEKIEKLVKDTAKEIDPELTVQMCGSYRRGSPTSGDVDILATHPKYHMGQEPPNFIELLVKRLKEKEFLTDDFSQGAKKYMGICWLPGDPNKAHRRIDLRLVPIESFGCALLYFTGSSEFNQHLRRVALAKGFTLSEYSICAIGDSWEKSEPLPVSKEEDVFNYLGIPFLPPNARNVK